MHRKTHFTHRHGFTLVEIMIVVAIIGLLASIAIPSFVRAREDAQKKTCVANLRNMDGMKQVWATENKKLGTDTPTESDLTPTYLRERPSCPAGGTYTIGAVNEKPTCSIASHAF